MMLSNSTAELLRETETLMEQTGALIGGHTQLPDAALQRPPVRSMPVDVPSGWGSAPRTQRAVSAPQPPAPAAQARTPPPVAPSVAPPAAGLYTNEDVIDLDKSYLREHSAMHGSTACYEIPLRPDVDTATLLEAARKAAVALGMEASLHGKASVLCQFWHRAAKRPSSASSAAGAATSLQYPALRFAAASSASEATLHAAHATATAAEPGQRARTDSKDSAGSAGSGRSRSKSTTAPSPVPRLPPMEQSCLVRALFTVGVSPQLNRVAVLSIRRAPQAGPEHLSYGALDPTRLRPPPVQNIGVFNSVEGITACSFASQLKRAHPPVLLSSLWTEAVQRATQAVETQAPPRRFVCHK